jgi:hypothetical protein
MPSYEQEQERAAEQRNYLKNAGCAPQYAAEKGYDTAKTGMLGGASERRSNIRQRIAQTLVGAEENLRRAHAARRAQEIIDAHPEFAELLDLLNEF